MAAGWTQRVHCGSAGREDTAAAVLVRRLLVVPVPVHVPAPGAFRARVQTHRVGYVGLAALALPCPAPARRYAVCTDGEPVYIVTELMASIHHRTPYRSPLHCQNVA